MLKSALHFNLAKFTPCKGVAKKDPKETEILPYHYIVNHIKEISEQKLIADNLDKIINPKNKKLSLFDKINAMEDCEYIDTHTLFKIIKDRYDKSNTENSEINFKTYCHSIANTFFIAKKDEKPKTFLTPEYFFLFEETLLITFFYHQTKYDQLILNQLSSIVDEYSSLTGNTLQVSEAITAMNMFILFLVEDILLLNQTSNQN